MNIAELFVRVRGDTTDVTRKLRGVETSMIGVENSAMRGNAGINRLRGGLVTLASQATGTNPALNQLASTVGMLAGGGTVVIGVLAGVAAIAFAYEKLTGKAREAREENEKLIGSFREAMKLKALGPGGREQMVQTAAETQLAEERKKLALLQADLNAMGEGATLQPLKVAQYTATLAEITRLQKDIAAAEGEILVAREASITPLGTVVIRASKGADEIKRMADESKRLNQELSAAGLAAQWMDDFAPRIAGAIVQRGEERDEDLGRIFNVNNEEIGKTVQPTVDGIKGPVLSIGDKITGAVKANGVQIATMLGQLASAMLVGGGGRGSQIGGALGGAAGGILTQGMSLWGASLGPLGAIAGGMLGSVIGGLFDKKAKPATNALNNLAEAARNVTESMRNLPSGFNVTAYRNRAATPNSPPSDKDWNGYKPSGPGLPTIYVANLYANSTSELIAEAKRAALRGGTSALRFNLGTV